MPTTLTPLIKTKTVVSTVSMHTGGDCYDCIDSCSGHINSCPMDIRGKARQNSDEIGGLQEVRPASVQWYKHRAIGSGGLFGGIYGDIV